MPPDHHTLTAARLAETVRTGLLLADRMAAQVLLALPVAQQAEGIAWRDVRPLLNPHEHRPESRDMHVQVLQYLYLRRLVVHHPKDWNLVRFTTYANVES